MAATSALPAINPFETNDMNMCVKEQKQKKDKSKKDKAKKDKSKKKKKNSDAKEPKPIRQAVGVIVIDKTNQKVLLIQGKKAYVLPRDDCKTEPTQENPEEAAVRLLAQKAGVQTQAVNTRIGTFSETNKKGKVTTYHWMYEVNDATILEHAERERIWVSLDEALKATEKKRMSHLALQKCSLAPTTMIN